MSDTRTVKSLTRKNSSRNGNPKFEVTFTDGTRLTTATDTSLAYGIENSEYKRDPHEVVTNRKGDLIDLRPVRT